MSRAKNRNFSEKKTILCHDISRWPAFVSTKKWQTHDPKSIQVDSIHSFTNNSLKIVVKFPTFWHAPS